MRAASAGLPVTLDIGPMFDDHWTGIPVFTRRLVQALDRSGEVDLTFSYGNVQVPRTMVIEAIRLGTGAGLRDAYDHLAIEDRRIVNRQTPLLFPSVKGRRAAARREASTVHDLSTLVMPEYHVEANIAFHLDHLSDELASDEAIFCVSEATRQALVSAYPSAAQKTRLLPQYVDWPEAFPLIARNLPDFDIGPYAVVIGTIEPRKNLGLLIAALGQPEVNRSDLKFVVVGRKGWKVDAFLAGLTPEHRAKLVFSGFVSEFVKYRLIQCAQFLVFPSIYEGFGIPALEAMSLGKPVLAARTSSFPEVIGDAGIYFDPLSPTEFASAFVEMSDERRRSELIPKALAHNATFDWRRMAAPVIDWLRE